MKAVGELIAPIVANALEMARRQRVLACIGDRATQKIIVMRWWERQEISDDQAELLIQILGLEAS